MTATRREKARSWDHLRCVLWLAAFSGGKKQEIARGIAASIAQKVRFGPDIASASPLWSLFRRCNPPFRAP